MRRLLSFCAALFVLSLGSRHSRARSILHPRRVNRTRNRRIHRLRNRPINRRHNRPIKPRPPSKRRTNPRRPIGRSQGRRHGDHRRIRLHALRDQLPRRAEAGGIRLPSLRAHDRRHTERPLAGVRRDRIRAFRRNRSGARSRTLDEGSGVHGGARRRQRRRDLDRADVGPVQVRRSLLRPLRPDPAARGPLQHQPRRRPLGHSAPVAG